MTSKELEQIRTLAADPDRLHLQGTVLGLLEHIDALAKERDRLLAGNDRATDVANALNDQLKFVKAEQDKEIKAVHSLWVKAQNSCADGWREVDKLRTVLKELLDAGDAMRQGAELGWSRELYGRLLDAEWNARAALREKGEKS